jgi:hypothetical protein
MKISARFFNNKNQIKLRVRTPDAHKCLIHSLWLCSQQRRNTCPGFPPYSTFHPKIKSVTH